MAAFVKIALINENSQAGKNGLIYSTLKNVAEPLGHEVFNYGMYSEDDQAQLTYVQAGILSAILLNSRAADYVVTGCGTGEGAMLACNSFPGVICGHVADPLDAYMFAQINDGNAIPDAGTCCDFPRLLRHVMERADFLVRLYFEVFSVNHAVSSFFSNRPRRLAPLRSFRRSWQVDPLRS